MIHMAAMLKFVPDAQELARRKPRHQAMPGHRGLEDGPAKS
jgi:hypothetical protein